jgi:hypothetical protein
MTLPVTITCPLGSTCEKIVDGSIHRCAWYVKIEGKNPQTGTDISESNCAIAWGPIISIEGNGQTRNLVASFQSLRNAALDNQKKALLRDKDD